MIYEKILKMMNDWSYSQKDKTNPHFKYSYVSDEATMAKFHELLVTYKIVQTPHYSVEGVHPSGNGWLFVVSLALTLTDVEDTESSVTVETVGAGWDSGDKGSGKAMTNASKYAVIKLLALSTGDDDPEADEKTDIAHAKAPAEALRDIAGGDAEPPKDLGNGFYAGVPIPNCPEHKTKARIWDKNGDGQSFRFYCGLPKGKQCAFVEYH